ncbi:MAG: hypothetical protein V1750_00740, partial [Acidobacteriota bacterium]
MRYHRTAVRLLLLLLALGLVGSVIEAGSRPPTLRLVTVAPAAASFELAPDPRPWTEKVAPSLLAVAEGGAGTAELVVTLREPAALVAFAESAPAHSARLRWLAATAEDLARTYRPFGVELRVAYSHLPVVVLAVPGSMLPALAGDYRVAAVAPNRRREALRAEGTALIRAPAVHALGYTGAGVGIAIVDTGVDYTHA